MEVHFLSDLKIIEGGKVSKADMTVTAQVTVGGVRGQGSLGGGVPSGKEH